MTTVDTQCNKVLYQEVFIALSRSLRGLAQPFYVPGSRLLFQPEIFVTVLAHTPFFTSEGQQVVAQGWKLNDKNVDAFLEFLKRRLDEITESVARVTSKVNEEREEEQKQTGPGRSSRNIAAPSKNSMTPDNFYIESLFDRGDQASGGTLIEDEDGSLSSASSLTIPPDIAMVNMYRCGLLALQLLPPQSNAGLVMISDGMLTLPSASILESMLTQSRNHNISCSFLQVSNVFSCL
jgi:hypothetical protein